MATTQTLLPILKIDLGIVTDAYDERLKMYLDYAKIAIEREGAQLQNNVEDDQLIVMYAAWTWRRRDSGEGMPRMLRYTLNNRVLGQKMSGSDG